MVSMKSFQSASDIDEVIDIGIEKLIWASYSDAIRDMLRFSLEHYPKVSELQKSLALRK